MADSEIKQSPQTESSNGEQSPPQKLTAETNGKHPQTADSGAETVQVEGSDNKNGIDDEKSVVKQLEFVQVAAMYLVMCFSAVYDYAKDNSGPLKPGVQAVESTVKTVIGPVWDKLRDVPLELLVFVDGKVEAALSDSDGGFPAVVKQASRKALSAANKAATEVRRSGGVSAAAKVAWKEYEPAAEEWAVAAWRWLNRLPLFPEVAQMVVPTAAYWSEKYNDAVEFAAERGFPAAAYLPVIPVERIAKVFEERGSESHVATPNGEASRDYIAVSQ